MEIVCTRTYIEFKKSEGGFISLTVYKFYLFCYSGVFLQMFRAEVLAKLSYCEP